MWSFFFPIVPPTSNVLTNFLQFPEHSEMFDYSSIEEFRLITVFTKTPIVKSYHHNHTMWYPLLLLNYTILSYYIVISSSFNKPLNNTICRRWQLIQVVHVNDFSTDIKAITSGLYWVLFLPRYPDDKYLPNDIVH